MHRFNAYIPIELFNRIVLMAEHYGFNKSEMMVKLIELGYIKMLEQGGKINETNNK